MLQHAGGNVYYAPGGVNVGVVKSDLGSAILIDTGLNDTAVRKVLREIEEEGRTVSAIITTHGHADHFGANAFVVKRTGAAVWAPAWDEAVLRYPMFQPLCLYAGADPPDSLRTGFMLAPASPVDVIYEAGEWEIDGIRFEAVSLAGHSGNQMGILVDGVFLCADVVFPDRVLDRYKMPYLFSARDHLAALDRADRTPHSFAIPGHGPAVEHLGESIARNRAVVNEVAETIEEICTDPVMPEEVLAQLLGRIGAEPTDPAAYYLLHPTAFAYLTYLEADGRLEHWIEDGRSLWRRT